jgi:hypothetical protein
LQTGAEGKGINDNGKYARRNVRDDGILIKWSIFSVVLISILNDVSETGLFAVLM